MDISDDDLPFWFPSPLEDLGGLTQTVIFLPIEAIKVSVPSRGLGSSNEHINHISDIVRKFPYPRED